MEFSRFWEAQVVVKWGCRKQLWAVGQSWSREPGTSGRVPDMTSGQVASMLWISGTPTVNQGAPHCPVHSWSTATIHEKWGILGPHLGPGHAWAGTNATLSSKTLCLSADKTKRLVEGSPVEHALTECLACSMSSRDLPVMSPETHSPAETSNPIVSSARNAQLSTTVPSAPNTQMDQGRPGRGCGGAKRRLCSFREPPRSHLEITTSRVMESL